MPVALTRRLIWFPIIHTPADLGSMQESIRRLYVAQKGVGHWAERLRTVEELWRTIRKQIAGLNLSYDRVRLYQDGLPDGEHAEKIVRDLARAGSENHRLLLELMERGATLTGTESPVLLLEEYRLAQQSLNAAGTAATANVSPGHAARHEDLSSSLLARRDAYIAKRIDRTLRPGETGLIFLGMLHNLIGRLPEDVELARLGERG
jgi:hypothetical protein